MTSITAIALTVEEIIEDAMAVGRMNLNLAQAQRESHALATKHVEAMYKWADSVYGDRMYGNEWEQWHDDHFYRVHCIGCEQHCRLD